MSKEDFEEVSTDVQVERHNLEVKMQRLTNADSSFNDMLSTIIEIAARAYELFKSSELHKKRRIIALLFPNLEISAQKLMFTVRQPFELFLKTDDHLEWLPGKDSNLRPIG